jgi:hypothetical protein
LLTFAKVLIMLIRLIAVFAIVLGILLLSGTNTSYLQIHIGIGFLLTVLVVILAILALVRGAVAPGIVGIVFAFLLPYVGLKQFPLRFGASLGWIQILHVLVALLTLGLAEMLHGKIRRAK